MRHNHRQLTEALDLPPATEPGGTVRIASTPRCGSHMPGHAMAATGLPVVPFAYANPANRAEAKRRIWAQSTRATLETVMARRTGTNGVLAIKAHHSHCAGLGGAAEYLGLWPKLRVIHLGRADILRQAISHAAARQTNGWLRSFEEARITPLSVRHEDAVRDLSGAVTQVARHRGGIGSTDGPEVAAATLPQARSGRSADWIGRHAQGSRRAAGRGHGSCRQERLVRS